jgi:hypothetical protein
MAFKMSVRWSNKGISAIRNIGDTAYGSHLCGTTKNNSWEPKNSY